MIKVYQKTVCKGKGESMRATVASLLELKLENVPNFIEFSANRWFPIFVEFFNRYGFEFDYIMNYSESEENILDINKSINGYFYASVPSRTHKGVSHAVIMNSKGLVVHDPNPNKLYLHENIIKTGNIISWYLFKKCTTTEQ